MDIEMFRMFTPDERGVLAVQSTTDCVREWKLVHRTSSRQAFSLLSFSKHSAVHVNPFFTLDVQKPWEPVQEDFYSF
jgi:hypothetical protein